MQNKKALINAMNYLANKQPKKYKLEVKNELPKITYTLFEYELQCHGHQFDDHYYEELVLKPLEKVVIG